jgi:gp16 family phage-associated protein
VSQLPQGLLEKVRSGFEERGESVAEWARAHSFPRHLVYAVLCGKCLAKRGKGHHIAVALGLKAQPENTQPHPAKERSIDEIYK